MHLNRSQGLASSFSAPLICAFALASAAGTCLAAEVADAALPHWMPKGVPNVLSERFDSSFEDTRTQRSIQEDYAVSIEAPQLGLQTGDPEDLGPRALCFAPGSNPTPDDIELINQLIAGGFSTRYQLGATWPGGANLSLTWSFVPDGTLAPNLNGVNGASALFATMDAQFGNRNWISLFEQSFARWSALAGITYTRVQSGANPWDDGAAWGNVGVAGARGDVRIAMRPFSNNDVLAFNSFPTNGDMVVNQNINWNSNGANNFRFARNVIMHEHGHGLGLAHTCPIANTKLMEPFLSTAFDGPQQDDVRGAQALYGDIDEDNNSAAAATDWGTLIGGANTTFGTPAVTAPIPVNTATLSVIEGDQDWYQFTLNEARYVTLTLRPIGSTYPEAPQDAACNTGTNIDALRQGDLQLALIGSNGTTIYRNSNDGGVGVNETATSQIVPAGRAYVRVNEVGTTSNTQGYTLQVQVSNTNITVTASDNTSTDHVALNWTNILNATNYRVTRNTSNATLGATTIADGLTTNSFLDTTAVPGTTYYYFVLTAQTGSAALRLLNATGEQGTRQAVNCGSIDFNGDGLFPDDADLVDFLSVLAGGPCSTGTCGSIDFNGDSLFPDDEDLVTFLRVLAGGPC
jgi:hypothetical protein